MPRERARVLVLSCEHASNAVPATWRTLFRGERALLASHRGWDPGALELARRLGRRTGAPLHAGRATRLLVDLNRSPHHRSLFSEITRPLPAADRARILERHYEPYRAAVEAEVARGLRSASVLHLSLHSFTPVLDGERRTADLGILYDPSRAEERRVAAALREAFRARAPELRVRRNYPYLGVADGFIPHLRRRFPATRYAGLELEVNQAIPLGPPDRWRALQRVVCEAVEELLAGGSRRTRPRSR